jgi:uncharacterized membrane protein YcaP (DUF421 family)
VVVVEAAPCAAAICVSVQVLFRLVGRKERGRNAASDGANLPLVAVGAPDSIVGTDASLTSALVGRATVSRLDGLLSYFTFRARRLADVIEGPPRQLVREGTLLERGLRRSRISRDQLLACSREKGRGSLAEVVRGAYLERSGRVSFILFDRPPQDERRA